MALSAAPETGKFLYPARRPELELHRAPQRICCRPARPSDLSASLWDHRNDTRTHRQGALHVRPGASLCSTLFQGLEGPPRAHLEGQLPCSTRLRRVVNRGLPRPDAFGECTESGAVKPLAKQAASWRRGATHTPGFDPGGARRAGLTALAAPCATRPLRPYSAQRNARDQRAHTCRRAEGEQSRERVNPVAERERLAGFARSLALGDPVPCPPSRQRRRARNCAEITSRTFTPRSPPNASPTPSSANSPTKR